MPQAISQVRPPLLPRGKVGYARLDVDQQEVSGIAIFKYASGAEASVLPTIAGQEFSLFVEKTATLDTGIAVCRWSGQPVSLKLFDIQGALVSAKMLDFSGNQNSQFLSQIFTLPSTFQGTLQMESDGQFAPLGLRFGGSTLSTIPVNSYVTYKTYFSPSGGTRQAIIDAINAADKTVDIAIYSFTADAIADALIAAKNRGVVVRIVADTGQAAGQGSDVDRLIAAGLNVKKKNGGSGGIMHDKVAIFDGKILLTGSYNWSANAEDNNRENALFIRTPEVVQRYQAHFEEVWQ